MWGKDSVTHGNERASGAETKIKGLIFSDKGGIHIFT